MADDLSYESNLLAEQAQRFVSTATVFRTSVISGRSLIDRGVSTQEGKAGDAMLLDSRCLHCGGANTSAGKRRRMLYVTFNGESSLHKSHDLILSQL